MKKNIIIALVVAALLGPAGYGSSQQETGIQPISGQVVEGYRVLTVPADHRRLAYTVYRGDYIKFRFEDAGRAADLSIPALSIHQTLAGDFASAPFFKMKKAGTYAISIDDLEGRIKVVEYRQKNYRELTIDEAAVIMKNETPLLLDVRTRGEYSRGHIAGSVLIPVQELQRRISELEAYQDKDILLYCATGNRSTVASKILIDQGFSRILNMRRGIAAWSRSYPVVR
jgi:rhodanese-related sulfurtransferase